MCAIGAEDSAVLKEETFAEAKISFALALFFQWASWGGRRTRIAKIGNPAVTARAKSALNALFGNF